MTTMTHHDSAAHSAAAPKLERSYADRRALLSIVLSVMVALMTLFAMVPLVSVLLTVIIRGGSMISFALFTELPASGGIANCIVGTIICVVIATAFSVPIGVLGAVYLSEFGRHNRTASVVRFCTKVLTGLPSLLAGVFAYAVIVLNTQTPSAVAGGAALAVLMLPIILLTSEEALRQVPQRMREAAIGIGCTRTQMVWKVVLPTALPNILTGVMLGIARAAGETAPLLVAAGFSYYFTTALMDRMPSLAVLIYNYSGSAIESQRDLAAAASLVLVVGVLITNICGRLLSLRARG